MKAHCLRQLQWSRATFGEGRKVEGICDHVEKELTEIRWKPTDLEEWIDLMTLAMDGATRCAAENNPGMLNSQVALLVQNEFERKHMKNVNRDWPAIEDQVQGKAVEHVRSQEEA